MTLDHECGLGIGGAQDFGDSIELGRRAWQQDITVIGEQPAVVERDDRAAYVLLDTGDSGEIGGRSSPIALWALVLWASAIANSASVWARSASSYAGL